MPEDVYEVLSLGMRYWFVALGILIVWRAFRWLRKDRRLKHRRLRQLPDAGMIGEMVVLVGSDQLPEGTTIPVPREGVLGFLRTCDMVVPVEGVSAQHVDFSFRDGVGLLLRPWRGQTCMVDGAELTHRTRPKENPMHHGSRLFVGNAVLRLRVFAGLEVARAPLYVDEDDDLLRRDEEPLPGEEKSPEAWQDEPYGYPPPPPAWPVQSPWMNPSAPPVDQSAEPWQPYAPENEMTPWNEDDALPAAKEPSGRRRWYEP